ncbi:hypothetical protein BDV26DRAFT_104232 [Aspergillus bertholletiae]|uniref:polynucleotide adenylyltransferase n=1 Tax=Aspergillus bertholletiae TaxID=1226010 RepID=A0A5N7ATR9_9EURO|nr:hypothetical protein BDV26DRAFT_104232 [Aspergillus bertholletiae]
MASNEENRPIALTSYETALCVVPPSHLTGDIDRLRALYDKAHGRWPPHANLIYPFVAPEALPQASKLLQSVLSGRTESGPIRLRLDKSDFFAHKRSNPVYLTDSGSDGLNALTQVQHDIINAFGGQSRAAGQLHLTVGQSSADDATERQFLLEKVGLIPAIDWEVDELVILIRDRSQGLDTASSPMVVWGAVSLSGTPSTNSQALGYSSLPSLPAHSQTTFYFSPAKDDGEEGKWQAIPKSVSQPTEGKQRESPLTVASYNVLVESPYPPPTERYPLLLQNLLSDAATADILLLQEVADDFLSFLLQDKEIRVRYPFVTHGPPDQAEIGPLNSLRNIVVLSRWQFRWEWVPFDKRHKGAVVLQLEGLGMFHDSEFLPLVVTGVHLSCGLIDSSIMAKRSQLQTVLKHLYGKYPNNHWIVAGDFNIATSSYTVDTALKRKSISVQGASVLASLDGMLTEVGLSDCYYASRASSAVSSGPGNPRGGFDLGTSYEGEEGATYDPTENEHAARIAGQSFHSRPQRYDRILVRGQDFRVLSYNLFGFPGEDESRFASDHWGVRATLTLDNHNSTGLESDKASITVEKAPSSLGDINGLKTCLKDHAAFPSDEEITQRKEVFELIKQLVNQRDANLPVDTRLDLLFAVVPVGSYGFGVWNGTSDMDILVIGQVSPRTFFALMIAKLRRSPESEVVLLRKVKAASGIMLELEVRGVRLDLQYCAATRVVESWPQVLTLSASDSAFDLPMQSLLKLNSLRDMNHLQRTIPDLASFRLAYRFIKIWAQKRGIYSSKLGYLGGIHITLLLARICTLSFRQAGTTSAADIITTFFKHYAEFNWEKNVVYDPSFYKSAPRYFRSQREPVVILTQHQPKVNVARAASIPSTRTLAHEFQRADGLLSKQDITWQQLAGSVESATGADEFLKSYRSYAKVNVQYWGGAATKGRTLVGWLEWRCVSLLVDIHRKFPDIHARIWPARFTDMEEVDETSKEYQGCYLIGLTRENAPGAAPLSDADRQSAQISLLAVLNTFAEQIRDDENYFDGSSSWVDVSLVQPSALSGLRVDRSNWGNVAYDDASLDDDEDEIDLEDEEDEGFAQPRRRTMPVRGAKAVSMPEGAKLRSASDVLNRLRWDEEFDIEDYIVGYDDRFLGEREMPVGQWKADLTDEAFIPMHRILYFRRKSDGVKVWDRETRTDLLFGSGASSKVQE